MTFSLSAVPDIVFGAQEIDRLCHHIATAGGSSRALIVMDGFLAASELGERLNAMLTAGGIEANIFSDFAGEPKLAHLRAAMLAAKDADMVIGIGGGSALDIAKITACTAASGQDPMHYALAANPLPENPLKKIMVPTTAGTGSETSATNIFSSETGKKLWIWGAETKANLVILDPALTISLPATMTAWCGLDAFVHAFEAATNKNAHRAGKIFAHEAMRLVARSLERAVTIPADLNARGDVLLGSCYAGIAIDNCGTAIAHNISHALVGLGPIHHGFATALGFEISLPWLVEADTDDLHQAATAVGLRKASELPGFVTSLMDAAQITRALPRAFAEVSAVELADEMRANENQPMRRSTIRDVTDGDIDRFAAQIMSLNKDM